MKVPNIRLGIIRSLSFYITTSIILCADSNKGVVIPMSYGFEPH
jgi:hypothetical protein